MSDFKVRFRDPQSGRQIELEANQKKESWSKSRVEESFDSATVSNDGNVDMMVSDNSSWFRTNHHLGIDTNNISSEDASALKKALEDPLSANLRVFDLQSGRDLSGLQVIKTDAAGELSAVTDNIDTTGTRRPVQLTPSGHIATPAGGEPQTLNEVGDGLFRTASLIDDTKGNLFDQIQAPAPLKQKLFQNLLGSLEQVAPGQPLPSGTSETQALQLRSSGATTMLELMTSKHNISNDFKARVFGSYEAAIKQETNPLLKDSMIFNLNRLQNSLPSALRDRTAGMMEAIAPTKPPYEKWFADGKDTVNIAFAAGDSESYKGALKHLQLNGFELVSDSGRNAKFTRTIEHNGQETKFELDLRYTSGDMYKEMTDDNVNILMYSGHSNWGRNVRESLGRAPEASGDGKLLLTDLCVGKGEIQMTRDQFPDAHLITTYNSSYYRPNDDSEGMHALENLIQGIAKRDGYEHIAEEVRQDNPWKWTHTNNDVDNNFIFPTDLETRRRVLDMDHDGQADVFDRMVNFNSFDVETDTAREFQAITPSRDAQDLVGTKIHFAAQTINRMTIYSGILKDANSTGEVVPGGYFTPKEGDGIFRFEASQEAGRPTVKMTMNADYAHMSEEALRMAASYEYSLYKADAGDISLNDRDAKLNGLIFAAHSLYTDAGHRDNVVWKEFLGAYNFPEISKSDVDSAKNADSHYYSGSKASLPALWGKLNPDTQAAFEQPGTGQIGG